MKGSVAVTWDHADDCPGNLSIFDAEWGRQPSLCRCGMPDWFDMHTLREIAGEALRKAVADGTVVIPGGGGGTTGDSPGDAEG